MNSPTDKLPDNWSHEWALPVLIPGDWFNVDPSTTAEMLEIFVSSLKAALLPNILADAPVLRVRAMPTSFYPGWLLVECQIELNGKIPALFCFLFGPDGAVLLDGASKAIYALNNHLKPDITGKQVAADYLRFFSSCVRSDLGRFQIIENTDDLKIRADTTKEQRDKIAKFPQPLSKGKKVEGGIRFEAIVRYGANLFKADYLVHPGGMVEMVDDDPLTADLPLVLEMIEGPFRVPAEADE